MNRQLRNVAAPFQQEADRRTAHDPVEGGIAPDLRPDSVGSYDAAPRALQCLSAGVMFGFARQQHPFYR